MIAVLMMAHGTPDRLDEMKAYLARVRGGRPPSPALVAEMRHNYEAIGGRSPLTDLTRAQAAALERELGAPYRVFVGMRNWNPFIEDAVAQAVAAGATHVIGLPMAPQFSSVSVKKYEDVARAAVPAGLPFDLIGSFHDHPGLLDAFSERVHQALDAEPVDAVIFTAHSLPRRAAQEGDPYPVQVAETAAGVAVRAGLGPPRSSPGDPPGGYYLAYQSAGRTPEPWLGPDVRDQVRALAAAGKRKLLAVPIGFVCDHTEILYDIEIAAREVARSCGADLRRTQSLNTSPTLIRALAAIVRART